MSSSPNNSLPDHPSSPTGKPPIQPAKTSISLEESPLSEDYDNMVSPSLPVDSERSSFSPADCRTLQKILHDVHSPSPLSPTPYFDDSPASRFNLTVTADSDANEDEVSCGGYGLAHSDERQDGYEDEDDSMYLSDDEDAFGAKKEGERDTIEDVMNMPGKTAPPVPVRDYSSLYAQDRPTPDGTEALRLRRTSIEKGLEEQCRQQEQVQEAVTADGVSDVDTPTDGVSNHGLDVGENFELKRIHEYIDMHRVEGQRVVSNALGSSEACNDSHRASISSSDIRRASEGTPLASNSFIDFPFPICAVVQTPNGKHIDFATSVPMPHTAVDNTPSYFETQEGDDVSLSKHQGNALSPEEIAALARKTRVEQEEAAEQRDLADLDQFRDMDLAPIETVIQVGPAGDLIMCGTPLKAKDEELFLRRASYTSAFEIEDLNGTQRSLSLMPSPCRHTLLVEQDEEHDADVDESDTASSSEQQRLAVSPRRPTFVTVIGMLPAVMFWATAAPVVEGVVKTFDMLIEKLTGLEV